MRRLVLCLFPLAIFAWPDGAPCSRVDNMTPRHTGGKTDEAPYHLTVLTSCYRPGVALKVVLSGKNGESFKGFIIQARDKRGVDRLGQFIGNSENGDDAWQFQCRRETDSITHKWNDNKQSVTVEWSAAFEENQPITFIATVVQSYSSYWVQKVKSKTVLPCKPDREEPIDEINIVETTTTRARTAIPTSAAEERDLRRTQPAQLPQLSRQGSPKLAETVVEQKQEDIKSGDNNRPVDTCDLPAEWGEYCNSGYTERWYHHRGFCHTFWYAGCGGNHNNFKSKKECLSQCTDYVEPSGQDPLAACKMDIDQGTWCRPPSWSLKWAFTKGRCTTFWFAGCDGNLNRFESEEQCKDLCESPLKISQSRISLGNLNTAERELITERRFATEPTSTSTTTTQRTTTTSRITTTTTSRPPPPSTRLEIATTRITNGLPSTTATQETTKNQTIISKAPSIEPTSSSGLSQKEEMSPEDLIAKCAPASNVEAFCDAWLERTPELCSTIGGKGSSHVRRNCVRSCCFLGFPTEQ